MATSNQVVEQSNDSLDPILRVFEDFGVKPIQSTIYDIQNKADAFRHASTPEKRCRLFDEFVNSNRSGLVMALACDDGFRTAVLDHFEQTFPTTVTDFRSSSAELAIKTLESFYPSVPASEFSGSLYEHQRTFLLATGVLDALTSVNLQPPDSPVRERAEVTSPKRRSQKEVKMARMKRPDPRVDDTPFHKFGFRRPITLLEYNSMVDEVLDKLKGILRDYLLNMGTPDILRHSVHMYISCERTVHSRRSPQALAVTTSTQLDAESDPANQETPILYPINPISTLQYFDDGIDGFGLWKILLSTKCERDFRRADAKRFAIIGKKLKELSHGFFSNDNQKQLTGGKTGIPVFEAKMESDTRLVYAVDCFSDGSCQNEIQVLKMFGVYSHNKLGHSGFWEAVSQHLQRRGPEHRKRCLGRKRSSTDSGYFDPMVFTLSPERYDNPGVSKDLDDSQLLQLHTIIALEKFVPFTQRVLNNILADEDSAYIFALSDRECQIIRHQSACFVVGRSGTGKTTTMLFKMLGVQRSSSTHSHRKIRQVFITQSRILAERVKEYYIKLVQSPAATDRHEMEIAYRAAQRAQAEKELMEFDDEDDTQSGLPQKFSELTDDHFPLFLTFDKLCQLLEADFCFEFKRKAETSEERRALRRSGHRDLTDILSRLEGETVSTVKQLKGQHRIEPESKVDYQVFRSTYWRHFPQILTKGLNPTLVWNEFIGVISGSEGSMATNCGYIDRDAYEQLSHRTQATFARQRSSIYDLFQSYIDWKRRFEGYDDADRTHALLHAIKSSGRVPGIPIDFLYCDEAQDNLLIDFKLMHSLCHNPHGFFWAGDTAQQITSTAFRFADLKAFLFRLEESDELVKLGYREAIHPTSFSLSINYRSHGGIVKCAQTVIETITHFWPNSIDVLDKEQGLVDGPKPLFFTGWEDNISHFKQFLFGEAGSTVEFGAEQCILVRDEAARNKLCSIVGDIGIIMTLREAKGLEFSDVLLYNFFSDSPASQTDWRVILNKIDHPEDSTTPAPAFDELRHAGICTELKFLYVGLTRARSNLWIWDSSIQAESMQRLWHSLDQIDIRTPRDSIPTLGVSSAAEEWARAGRDLFSKRRYRQGKLCFERAGLHLERDISHAYQLRQDARLIEHGSKKRELTFLRAADILWDCASNLNPPNHLKCFLRSAECYVQGDRLIRASEAYYHGKEWTLAARYARMAEHFDRAIEIIDEGNVDKEVAESIRQVCKLVYIQRKQVQKAKDLFKSDDDLLKFMDVYGFDKTPILITLRCYIEAGKVRAAARDFVKAVNLFIEGGDHDLAAQCLCDAFWQQLPYNGLVTDNNRAQIRDLEQLSARVYTSQSGLSDELLMFRSIIKNDISSLKTLCTSLAKIHPPSVALLRCLNHLSAQPQEVKSMTVFQMHSHLTYLQLYATRYRGLTRTRGLEASALAQRLFGFSLDKSGVEATVLLTSFISHQTDSPLRRIRINGQDQPVVDAKTLGTWIIRCVEDHMISVLHNHAIACLDANSFAPLCPHYLDGRIGCSCSRHHVRKDCVATFYNVQLCLYLKQIEVLNCAEPRTRRRDQRNLYLRRIFDVIFPSHESAGNITSFTRQDSSTLQALAVLRSWIYESALDLDVGHPTSMLKTLLMASALDASQRPNFRRSGALRRAFEVDHGYRVDMENNKQPLFLDLINALFQLADGSVELGLAFLQYAIENRQTMRIALHPLTVFLELWTTTFVGGIAAADLNHVILPRSSLFHLAQRRHRPKVDVWILLHLLRPLQEFVKDLYDGKVHKYSIFDSRADNFSNISMSYNHWLQFWEYCSRVTDREINHNALQRPRRRRLPSTLGEVSPELRYLAHVLNGSTRYLKAEDWSGLAEAAYASFDDCPFDKVVRLVLDAGPQVTPSKGKLVDLRFSSESAFYHHFAASPILTGTAKSRLAGIAKPCVLDRSQPPPAPVQGQYIIRTPTARPSATVSVKDLEAPATAEEDLAALAIQLAYKMWCQRREANKKADERIAKWHNQCLKVRPLLGGPKSYTKYFLGPLVHVLIWVESAIHILEREREAVQKEFKKPNHKLLEGLEDRFVTCSRNYERAIELQKQLSPTSEVHRRGQIDELRELVTNLQTLTERVELGNVEMHRILGWKGVVILRRVMFTKPIKPMLNTSDLLEG